ncbi:MAG: hypothetical protein AB7L17_10435 [Ilumatobacteraceae bacterium]
MANLTQPAELVQAGVPNLDINHMTGWYGGDEGGHIGFSPVAPMTGKHALALRDLMRGIVENDAQLDYQAAILLINPRSFIHITMLLFDTKDEAQCRRAYDTSKLLVREAAKHGYGEYRAHLDFMDLVADQYSFGDHAYRRFCETIKTPWTPTASSPPAATASGRRRCDAARRSGKPPQEARQPRARPDRHCGRAVTEGCVARRDEMGGRTETARLSRGHCRAGRPSPTSMPHSRRSGSVCVVRNIPSRRVRERPL